MAKYISNGMKDMPEEKKKIAKVIADLTELLTNEERHLADVGCGLRWCASRITECMDEAFKLHEERKAQMA